MFRVLIGDDDVGLCALLTECLRCEGFDASAVHDTRDILKRLRDPLFRPDLLILDVMMPGQNGLDVLRELRIQYRLPVIMLSGRGEPVDRIIGLELGADDYVSKPCLPRELIARVRAQLRRHTVEAVGDLCFGVVRLVPSERAAYVDHQRLALTSAEFAILLHLIRHAGEVIDKAALTRVGLGRQIERFDRSIDMRVSKLRHKLASASAAAPRIDAVRGAGYVLLPNHKDEP